MKYLRELAKDFAQGKISREEYRKERTELIKGIVDGSIDVPDRDFLAPIPPPSEDDITAQGPDYDPFATTEIAVTKPGSKKKQTSANRPTPPRESSDPVHKPFPIWTFAILSVAVLVLIIAITALFIYSSENTESPESTVTEQPAVGQAANQLIKLFIQGNNWQAENLEKFRRNWEKIGPAERQAAQDLPVMNQLKNAIYKQLLEERAMIALGDAESAREKQQVLVDFAESLGIQDDRLKVDP